MELLKYWKCCCLYRR